MSAKIAIYTDGSCLGNPGPGGWAAIIINNDKREEISGLDYATTNNRMEMMAIIEALKAAPKQPIHIYSDSNLLVQSINEGWKRKANTDLWELLDAQSKEKPFTISWVKAHAKNKLNNEVDALALKQAKKAEKAVKANPDLIPEPDQKALF